MKRSICKSIVHPFITYNIATHFFIGLMVLTEIFYYLCFFFFKNTLVYMVLSQTDKPKIHLVEISQLRVSCDLRVSCAQFSSNFDLLLQLSPIQLFCKEPEEIFVISWK